MPSADKFFTENEKHNLVMAIKQAELNTSGEIRLHIENVCTVDVLDRAAFLFEKLEMHKTDLRNGVLFYMAIRDRKFAILGDAGINKVTPDDFWDGIKSIMLEEFKENRFENGLSKGILMAGDALKKWFPYSKDDKNELTDDISFGT